MEEARAECLLGG